jgi:hypothetical protein
MWDHRRVDPQDDPEARIRELERSLNEQARISEVGTGQPGGYVTPPTPPPVTYGAPLPPIPGAPLRTAAGFRGWWIVLAVFAVGVVPLVVGIVALGAHLFSSGGSMSSGGSIFGSPGNRPSISRGNGAPSTTPQQTPPQLLTPGGLTGLEAQMQKQFGDTMGYELVVYPEYAVLTRPDSANAHKTVDWYYGSNGWMNQGTTFIPMDTTLGDLSTFDVQAVLGVLGGAPQSLHIDNPTSNYLIIDSAKDGGLDLQIHLSDGTDSGYIELAGDGTVKRIYPPSP